MQHQIERRVTEELYHRIPDFVLHWTTGARISQRPDPQRPILINCRSGAKLTAPHRQVTIAGPVLNLCSMGQSVENHMMIEIILTISRWDGLALDHV